MQHQAPDLTDAIGVERFSGMAPAVLSLPLPVAAEIPMLAIMASIDANMFLELDPQDVLWSFEVLLRSRHSTLMEKRFREFNQRLFCGAEVKHNLIGHLKVVCPTNATWGLYVKDIAYRLCYPPPKHTERWDGTCALILPQAAELESAIATCYSQRARYGHVRLKGLLDFREWWMRALQALPGGHGGLESMLVPGDIGAVTDTYKHLFIRYCLHWESAYLYGFALPYFTGTPYTCRIACVQGQYGLPVAIRFMRRQFEQLDIGVSAEANQQMQTVFIPFHECFSRRRGYTYFEEFPVVYHRNPEIFAVQGTNTGLVAGFVPM